MLRVRSRSQRATVSIGLALLLLSVGLSAVWTAACGEDAPMQTSADQADQAGQAAAPQPTERERPNQTAQTAQTAQPAQPEQSERTAQAETSPSTAQATESSSGASSQAESDQPNAQTGETSAQQQTTAESVPAGTRLISLFGDLTEIIYALGVEDYLVGRDTSSVYPPAAEALPNLGFAGSLNAEAILALDPSLVIGTPMAGPPGVLEQLRDAGVELLIVDDLKGLDAPQIKIRFIGEALGIPQAAEALAQDVAQRLEGVMAAAADIEQPLRVLHVYIRRGGLQLVSGEGNRAQAIIEAAGGVDAAAAVGISGWQPLTPEALVAADPDVYLVMDLGLRVIGGIDALWDIPGMAETKAGQAQHVISMPDLYLLGFGPRLPEAIADLTEYLRSIQADQVDQVDQADRQSG